MKKPQQPLPEGQSEPDGQHKPKRAAPNKMAFTDLGIRRLNVKEHFKKVNAERRDKGLEPIGQLQIWDEGCDGLSLLISAGGTKAFRATFKLHGKWQSCALGRFGEMVPNANPKKQDVQITEARARTSNYRAMAKEGIDPRLSLPVEQQPDRLTFNSVIDRYIADARDHQRTWDQTERILRNCKSLLPKPMTSIGKRDTYDLLDSMKAKPAKAAVTFRWLKVLWKWAFKRDLVSQNIIEGVDFRPVKRKRTRVYNDAEIAAIWNAANQLDAIEGAFFKLMVLLAPRKTALAAMQWSDLNDAENPSLWITPPELTKTRKSADPRTYQTPLPPLAQRIIKGLPKGHERVFPSLRVRRTRGGTPKLHDPRLIRALIKFGAPKDFSPHAMRHTIATWLHDAGHSEWERGLILNHAESTVTGGYSHGFALNLKRELLEEWADHVEALVQPQGVALLR